MRHMLAFFACRKARCWKSGGAHGVESLCSAMSREQLLLRGVRSFVGGADALIVPVVP